MTEQKYLRLFFTRYWKFWIGALVVGVVLGYFISYRLQPSYQGSVNFTVNRVAEDGGSTNYYRYDGYYAAQAALLARNDLLGWLQSPQTVYEVYREAQLEYLAKKAGTGISKLFVPLDTVSQNATITFATKNEQDSSQLASTLAKYVQDNYRPANYTVSSGKPVVLAIEPQKRIITLGVGLVGLFLAFVISLMMHYFSQSES